MVLATLKLVALAQLPASPDPRPVVVAVVRAEAPEFGTQIIHVSSPEPGVPASGIPVTGMPMPRAGVIEHPKDADRFRFLIDTLDVDPMAMLKWLDSIKFADADYLKFLRTKPALIDPRRAVERVEALPEDPAPGTDPYATKNQARIYVARLMALQDADRWRLVYEQFLYLWTPDQGYL
jgi:hypothetical protein